jgi:RNA polymerase sigma-70 factor (ECF subfamily)
MNDASDSQYIAELKKGSHKAFDYFYNTYSDLLYGFVLLHTKSPLAAEEIVQDAFVKIWTSRHLLRVEGSFKALLFTIAKNRIIDSFRRQINKIEFINIVDYYENEGYACNSVEMDIFYDEFLEKLELAKKKLSPRQCLVFELNREKGFDIKTISKKLEISEQTVKNHLLSALKTLRSKLEKDNFLFFIYL